MDWTLFARASTAVDIFDVNGDSDVPIMLELSPLPYTTRQSAIVRTSEKHLGLELGLELGLGLGLGLGLQLRLQLAL